MIQRGNLLFGHVAQTEISFPIQTVTPGPSDVWIGDNRAISSLPMFSVSRESVRYRLVDDHCGLHELAPSGTHIGTMA